MAHVTGIGGVFFRAKDPEALLQWYVDHLGIKTENGYWEQPAGNTVFQPFPADTDYFRADKATMLNFRVDDMDAMCAQLDAAGIAYEVKPEWDAIYGRFTHLEDPEGNPIELWEPIAKADEGDTD